MKYLTIILVSIIMLIIILPVAAYELEGTIYDETGSPLIDAMIILYDNRRTQVGKDFQVLGLEKMISFRIIVIINNFEKYI